ncbi:hypothetical protein Psta_1704 [Pirellula staleyi DSM 6068]|uniref:Type I restriction enzyme R protein N-terminal domain-containing protein n=1 Tax=Pirellula staleyi (strain ATCC 27377 / DSM 6068 / ICPB 4128) TaxID=530564 RepID=D2QYS4_PIRSD|nr:type I restriction enzyme HsdR N-terminal domain-containing protein [Pirellula staleyi]ADB16379.1 hypothetical protein Psta_1704 [Pirellula staleyi DSM 6068]
MSEVVAPNNDSVLGVTVCTNCQKRFRLPKKHESFIGKSVRCSSCHQPFVVKLEVPSQVEQAAIQNAETQQSTETDEGKRTRTRRTKTQIREEHLARINEHLKSLHKRLIEINEQGGSEEQVRVWCIDVLRLVLGYEDCDIDTEVHTLGQRIDIALKHDDRIFLVIECKNPRLKLSEKVRDQAAQYASSVSADWAVTTNGSIWSLYRVIPRRGQSADPIKVFDAVLLDEDGISEADVANFYLLTSRALFNGETMCEFHRRESASYQRILSVLSTDRVVNATCKALIENYQAETGEKPALTEDYIRACLADMFLPDEL